MSSFPWLLRPKPAMNMDQLPRITASGRRENLVEGQRLGRPLSTVDVYDLASDIRGELERVIETVGCEAVGQLIPKVVQVLEHLERVTKQLQKENVELDELRFTVEKFNSDQIVKESEKEKHRKEMETIEECWRTETEQLTDYCTNLDEENAKLRLMVQDLKENEHSQTKEVVDKLMVQIRGLHDKASKQRDQIRLFKRDINQKETDIEALQLQIDRFTKLNVDHRHRNSLLHKQIENLVEEKSDLETKLHDVNQQIDQLKRNPEDCVDGVVNRDGTLTFPDGYDEFVKSLNLDGKMIIDLNNPDKPRYSLTELREVLKERNDLKSQLFQATEQLLIYKPDLNSEDSRMSEETVEGPINREPDEKLHPEKYSNKPSGIHRIFRQFFEKLDQNGDNR